MHWSVIIPVLNEAQQIQPFLTALQPLREQGHELVLVDGGSTDATVELARDRVDQLVEGQARGRAKQMNAGARRASGGALLFLHADTCLPGDALGLLSTEMSRSGKIWGRFDVQFSGAGRVLSLVATMMNLRSRLTGIATGDQAIFMTRRAFDQAGGFPEQPLMEDIEISRRLKSQSRPLCMRDRVVTSSRRWEQQGLWRTIFLMWQLRLLYFLGVSPARLVRRYYG